MDDNQHQIEDINVDRDLRIISINDLLGKFKSKSALYTILTDHLQYYLPTRRGTPMKFLRSILKGKKQMLKAIDVRELKVPNYPEISVENLWEKFKDDDEVKMYFPDFTEKQKPERKFLLDILSTIRYDYMCKVIKFTHQARNLDEKVENNEVIEIKQDLLDEIMMANYSSNSKGKALFLLKKSANLSFQRGNRRVRELPDLEDSNDEEEKKE